MAVLFVRLWLVLLKCVQVINKFYLLFIFAVYVAVPYAVVVLIKAGHRREAYRSAR